MALKDLNDLYGDAILDHRRHPRNHSRLEESDIVSRAVNPFCGDEVDLQIVIEAGRVSEVGVQAEGCSINQATASMLSEVMAGKTLHEIEALAVRFREAMSAAGPSEDSLDDVGDLHAILSVRDFPVRIKCALLPWTALEDAIESHRRGR